MFKIQPVSVKKIVYIAGCTSITLICLYLSSFNVVLYLRSKSVFIAEYTNKTSYKWPSVIFCPSFPFNPERLRKFVLETDDEQCSFPKNLAQFYNWEGLTNEISYRNLSEAAWRVGEVISNVSINGKIIRYSLTDEIVDLWSSQVIYQKPCLLFTPPPTNASSGTLKITLRSGAIFDSCDSIDNRTIDIKFNESCPEKKMKIRFNKHGVKGNIYLRRISDSFDVQPFSPIRHLFVIKTFVEYYERKSLHNTGIDAFDCVDKCNSLDRSLGCSVLNQYTLDLPLSSLCPFSFKWQEIIEANGESCRKKCSHANADSFWRLRYQNTNERYDKELSITLQNINVMTLSEVEKYPLTKLLSEMGGNVGLFIGLSVLAGLRLLLQRIFSFLKHFKKSEIIKFILLALKICIFSMMLINMVSLITMNSKTTVFNSMNLKVKLCQRNHDCATNSSVSEWMNAIFLRPMIGCHPQTNTKRDICLSTCLFSEISDRLPPAYRWYLLDLPNCSFDDIIRVRSMNLVLVNNPLDTYETKEILQICDVKCNNFSNNTEENSLSFSPHVKETKNYSFLDTLCLVAGLVGLYFGYSLFDILNHFNITENKVLEKLPVKSRLLIPLTYGCLLLFAITIIITSQIYAFVFKNLRFIESSVLSSKEFPRFTVCPKYHPGVARNNSSQFPKTIDRHFSSLEMLSETRCTHVKSFVGHLEESTIQSNPSDCFSCKPEVESLQTFKTPRICIKVHIKPQFINSTKFMGFIHMGKHDFVWDVDNQIEKYKKFRRTYVESVTSFSRAGFQSAPSQCYSACLRKIINGVISRRDGEFSDIFYASNEHFTEGKKECEKKCRGFSFNYIAVTGKVFKYLRNATDVNLFRKDFVQFPIVGDKVSSIFVCITYNFQSIQNVEEVFGYHLSQLISDICSVIGIAFGVSCLTLWKTSFNAFAKKFNKISP